MKKTTFLFFFSCLLIAACQKSVNKIPDDPILPEVSGEDSSITDNDTLTYEVITKDANGWYGIWNDENGNLSGTGLDSGAWGNAIYFPSGWKYTFVPKTKPLNMMVSAAAKSYSEDITINFYRNGQLIKRATNSSMKGVCKLMLNSKDTLMGTAENPVITYEVLLNNMDSTKFEFNGWSGQFLDASGKYSENPLALNFAFPSGWKYTFRPQKLPFTLGMQGTPYASEMTINFYVNGQLVKTKSAYDWIYDMTYNL